MFLELSSLAQEELTAMFAYFLRHRRTIV
jgi:hypothetical protein